MTDATNKPLAVGLHREAVARVIDSKAWAKFDRLENGGFADHITREQTIEWSVSLRPSLVKADAILAIAAPAEGEKHGRGVLWGEGVPHEPTPAPVYWTVVGPKLVEALEPFAKLWDGLSEDDRIRRAWRVQVSTTSDAIRTARAALAAAQPQPNGE